MKLFSISSEKRKLLFSTLFRGRISALLLNPGCRSFVTLPPGYKYFAHTGLNPIGFTTHSYYSFMGSFFQ